MTKPLLYNKLYSEDGGSYLWYKSIIFLQQVAQFTVSSCVLLLLSSCEMIVNIIKSILEQVAQIPGRKAQQDSWKRFPSRRRERRHCASGQRCDRLQELILNNVFFTSNSLGHELGVKLLIGWVRGKVALTDYKSWY